MKFSKYKSPMTETSLLKFECGLLALLERTPPQDFFDEFYNFPDDILRRNPAKISLLKVLSSFARFWLKPKNS